MDRAIISNDKQSPQEASRAQAWQNSLRILDGISSWHVWACGLMVLLLLASLVLLFLVTPAVIWALRGLLALVCVLGAAFFSRQRYRLALIRSSLIAQMDATTRARVEAEKLQGLATVDPLTGLYNRRFGETRLKEEIERAEKSSESLVLLALDFDKFKQINDTYGHAAGDLALKAFSKRLQRAIRACDVPIRVGGDEFLVVFPDCPLDKISEILFRMDSISFDFGGKQIPVSFSHGIAQYEVSDTPEKMIQRADARLYAHKAKRKSSAGADSEKVVPAETNPQAEVGLQQDTIEAPECANLGQKSNSHESASIEANGVDQSTPSLDVRSIFRRSSRVDFKMPIDVHVIKSQEEPVVQECKTVNVSAHGALLALNAPVEIGQRMRLFNPRTQQEINCLVRRLVLPTPDGLVQVGVEFVAVAPAFWDIATRPWDWDSSSPAPEPRRTQPLNPQNPAPLSRVSDVASEWGNDKYDAKAVQPFLDPAWTPAEGGPLQAPPSARVISNEMWGDLDKVIHDALKGFEGLPQDQKAKQKTKRLLKEKPKEGLAAHKQLVIGLFLAFSCVAFILLMMPGKSVANRGSASGAEYSHSASIAEAAPATVSKPNSAAPTGESGSGATSGPAGPAALPTEVAQGIPDLAGFRLATADDFDPAAASWLRTRGQQADANIPGNYTGSGESHAYILRGKDKSWRVLIITDGQVSCDFRYPTLAVAARVPKEYVHNIQWNEPTAPEFDGDGLLIVRSADDPASGVILSLHSGDVYGSHPVDYRQNLTK